MALRVEDTGETDVFVVHGRGELHLTILVENMRREGYELAVGRPRVITRTIDGVTSEPYEALTVDVEDAHQGAVMEALGGRRGDLVDMQPDGRGRVRIDYRIPARGLIGFQNEFMNLTRGTGIMTHVFDEYGPLKGDLPGRRNGVLVSQDTGEAVAFALFNLQERGRLFVSPGEKIYEGMVVGINSRDNDLIGQPAQGQEAHQHPRRRQGRQRSPHPADQAHARVGGRVHRGRRAGRGDTEVDPDPQALPESARAQARGPDRRERFGLSVRALRVGAQAAPRGGDRWAGKLREPRSRRVMRCA